MHCGIHLHDWNWLKLIFSSLDVFPPWNCKFIHQFAFNVTGLILVCRFLYPSQVFVWFLMTLITIGFSLASSVGHFEFPHLPSVLCSTAISSSGHAACHQPSFPSTPNPHADSRSQNKVHLHTNAIHMNERCTVWYICMIWLKLVFSSLDFFPPWNSIIFIGQVAVNVTRLYPSFSLFFSISSVCLISDDLNYHWFLSSLFRRPFWMPFPIFPPRCARQPSQAVVVRPVILHLVRQPPISTMTLDPKTRCTYIRMPYIWLKDALWNTFAWLKLIEIDIFITGCFFHLEIVLFSLAKLLSM